MVKADTDVDERYGYMRGRFGGGRPEANGYRLGSFFTREQRVVMAALEDGEGPVLDAACGSGLMLAPLTQEQIVFGLDFNEEACADAKANGVKILRGDAFNMPLVESSVGQIVNCQFLNQQPSDKTKIFIDECARVLKSGGRVILLWRHAQSLIHRTSHMMFRFMDQFTGQPDFPQYVHPIEEIKAFAEEAGLEVERESVTLPFLKPDMIASESSWSGLIGASLFIVLRKP